jgi:hypothetical protein
MLPMGKLVRLAKEIRDDVESLGLFCFGCGSPQGVMQPRG